uniref:NADH dehydrogenase subunit 2 n=1 Tax=Palisada intermedia TaxID=397057 RepID=UPI00286B3AAE|nr:NADH dehydrogenase subunit 2 [Palisada intermedia]WMC20763.1 NADH dehydrogenase subunit 2 [Palisada intermedia]
MTLNIFYLNIYPILVEFFFLITICFCLVFAVILSGSTSFYFPVLINNINFFFLQILIYSFCLIINMSPIYIIYWNNFLICDSFVFYSKNLILFFSIVWFFIFFGEKKILNFEFWILILLSILSIFFLIQSNDLLSVYVNIEFLSLTFYILASFKRNSEFSTEAGLKYFILGAFSSSLLLFGFTLLYGFTGLTNFQDLSIFFNGSFKFITGFFLSSGFFLSLFCILTAFLFKLGTAPFHYWLPDVYEGSSTIVTAFFAILSKLPILILLIKFIFVIFLDLSYQEIFYFLLFCTLTTSIIGTFGAFSQLKWKRFLAFSSISHLGFFLLNLCTLNPINLTNLIIYLIIYLIMTCSFFSFFNSLIVLKYPNVYFKRFLHSVSFLNLLNPVLGFSFAIILFSFAGVPPLAGFFSKFFVLFSAISQNFFGIVFLLLVLNCLACFYYIKIIKQIYFQKFENITLPIYISSSKTNIFVFGFLLLLTLFGFLNLDFLFLIADLMCLNF